MLPYSLAMTFVDCALLIENKATGESVLRLVRRFAVCLCYPKSILHTRPKYSKLMNNMRK